MALLIKKFISFFVSDPSALSISASSCPIQDQPRPDLMIFPYDGKDADSFVRPYKVGDTRDLGDSLIKAGDQFLQPCPVRGTIKNVKHIPDVHGGSPQSAVFMDLDPVFDRKMRQAFFEPINLEKATSAELQERIKEARIVHYLESSALLSDLLEGCGSKKIIISAVDKDPNIQSQVAIMHEKKNQLASMMTFFNKLTGADSLQFAMFETDVETFAPLLASQYDIIAVPNKYPNNLPGRVDLERGFHDTCWITLEALVQAYEAVVHGFLPSQKVVTVIRPDGSPEGVFRYFQGTPLKDALEMAGIELGDGDGLIVGGMFHGVAQYNLDGVIDATADGLMVIPQSELPHWSHDPCVSCGSCNDVCPIRLQVSLMTRYCEFGMYENARQLDLDACIDCGLCASECSTRRPLLQLIQLGKQSLTKQDHPEDLDTEPKADDQKPGMFQDPALALYQTPTRYTVGAAPFRRAKTNLTALNSMMLLALLPAVVISAACFMAPAYVANQGTAFGAIPGLLNRLIGELGVGPSALMLMGVFGISALGMGAGVLIEYATQVLMRQRYEATNAHGALIGLLVAMLMPPTVSPLVLLLTVAIAIIIGKQLFGGIGSYPIHPAIVGWLIVFVSWPHDIHPIGAATLASVHPAVMIAMAVTGIGLGLLRIIRLRVPIGVLIGVLVFSFLFKGRLQGDLLDQVLSGHVMLAAFFLATDSTSSPINKLAGWLYGLGIGFMIVLIRAYGVWPDAVPFAVMLMNILSPLLDRIRPKVLKEAV